MQRLARDEAGNALMIIAASLLPLLAMVGGGIDMGRGYLVQARLQQACDAGVLAARKRLGTEAAVSGSIPTETAEVGDLFFKTNFRDASYGSTDRSFSMTLEEDYEISGVASARMPTTLMGVFGYEYLDITTDCRAQITASNTDIVMALDVTGSMAQTNLGDSDSRIDILRATLANFYTQLASVSAAGTRVRYGFVPYASNVNVGHLLKDEWVTDEWAYQSRELKTTGTVGTRTYDTFRQGSTGTDETVVYDDTYAATSDGAGGYYCEAKPDQPANTYGYEIQEIKTETETVLGPPAGEKTTVYKRSVENGDYYWVGLDGQTCIPYKRVFIDRVVTFETITEPSFGNTGTWTYDRLNYDVSNWRAETEGCMEERQTYEIADYDNVDFNRALDLNIDLVPTDDPVSAGITVAENLRASLFNDNGQVTIPSGAVTKWRPMYPEYLYARAWKYDNTGWITTNRINNTTDEYVAPATLGNAPCPAPASQLAEMTESDFNSYLASLSPLGATYHDIGMIWAGRLISPTGLFATENADVEGAQPTNRNVIFLTDGETAPQDLFYSPYGFEPLDQRRWKWGSALSLAQTVEKRFAVACDETKKRGVTVWVIGFGVALNPIMQDCAGEGYYFEADDAVELNGAFATIAKHISSLRITE